jgi:hypothetical protein
MSSFEFEGLIIVTKVELFDREDAELWCAGAVVMRMGASSQAQLLTAARYDKIDQHQQGLLLCCF